MHRYKQCMSQPIPARLKRPLLAIYSWTAANILKLSGRERMGEPYNTVCNVKGAYLAISVCNLERKTVYKGQEKNNATHLQRLSHMDMSPNL